MDITRIRTVLALRWLYGWKKTKTHNFCKRFQNSFYTFNDWRSCMQMQQQWNDGCAKFLGVHPFADLDLNRHTQTNRLCATAYSLATMAGVAGGMFIGIGQACAFSYPSTALGVLIAGCGFSLSWLASWTMLHNLPTIEAHLKPGTLCTVMQLPSGGPAVKPAVYLTRNKEGTWLNIISPSGLYATLAIRERPAISIIQRAINEVVEATKEKTNA